METNVSNFPVIGNFVVTKYKIIFLDNKSNTYCINSKSGALIWKYKTKESSATKLYSTLLSDGNKIFF